MKINKTHQLDKVASGDGRRRALGNISVTKDGERHVAVATNGRTMAIVPVETEAEHELGLISPAALKHARKLARKNQSAVLSPNGNISFSDGSALPRPTEQDCGTFPRWQVIRDNATKGKPTFTVGLDPKLLLDLAQAIGFEAPHIVQLEFVDNKSPIRVTIPDQRGALGILMPGRLSYCRRDRTAACAIKRNNRRKKHK